MISRELTTSERTELLNLKRENIDMRLLRGFFAVKGNSKNNKARFNTYDKFTMPQGVLGVKAPVQTTIGRYIFNLVALPEEYIKKHGYQNSTLTKKDISRIENQMASMILDDEMTTDEYAKYLDRTEWLTMGMAHFLSPTMTIEMNMPIPEVIKRRDELFTKHKTALAQGDTNVVEVIENELIEMARDHIKKKGLEPYSFFESGGFSFENNYKKTSIMGGAMVNPYTQKIDVLKSNFVDGITKEELPIFANSTITGGYSRGIETAKSGYTTKKINNATQAVTLDEPGSDCGTTEYLDIVISKETASMFHYRWVLDGGKEVLITSNNIDRYIGKELKMRSPMFCKSEKICSKCAGDLHYRLGVKNAGLLTSTLSGSLMNLALKKTHDQTVRFDHIKIDEFIKER